MRGFVWLSLEHIGEDPALFRREDALIAAGVEDRRALVNRHGRDRGRRPSSDPCGPGHGGKASGRRSSASAPAERAAPASRHGRGGAGAALGEIIHLVQLLQYMLLLGGIEPLKLGEFRSNRSWSCTGALLCWLSQSPRWPAGA